MSGFQPGNIYYNIISALILFFMEKTCNVCKCVKDITEFSRNKSKKDGYNNICKECFKLYRDNHYLNNKDYYIKKSRDYRNLQVEELENLKKDLKCEICGEGRYYCLDFHHNNSSEKEGNISTMIRFSSFKKVKEEILKCRILCANCHRELHHNEKSLISI